MSLEEGSRRDLPTVGRPETEAVRSMFASLAGRYDLLNTLLSQGQDRRWRRRAAQLARVRRGDRALDVCCGTGALSRILQERCGPGGEVVGLDLTEAMLELARRRLPGIEFRAGDATRLPFPEASFDVATMAFGLRNIEDKGAALRELLRVLRPGGRAVILEFSQVVAPLRPGYRLYSRLVIPRLARLVLGRDGAYRYLTQSIAAFPSPQGVEAWLRAAGFRSVRHHAMSFGVVSLEVGIKPGAGLSPGAAATPQSIPG